jgi:hypothetical protein
MSQPSLYLTPTMRVPESYTHRQAVLTPARKEDFDGNILQQIATWEDGAHLGEIPLAMQMVAVLEHLKQRNRGSVLGPFEYSHL